MSFGFYSICLATWKNQTLCGMNRGGCQHACRDYEGSLQCSCYEGFEKVKTNPKRCEGKYMKSGLRTIKYM